MIPLAMGTFRTFISNIVLPLPHLRCLALVTGGAAAASIAAPTRADFLLETGTGQWVWNGGMATNLGGMWVGSGWDRFPGVNPPWNPVSNGAPLTPWETGLAGRRSLGGYRGACVTEPGFGRALPSGACGLPVPMPDPQVVVVPIVVVEPPAQPRPRFFYAPGDDCGRGTPMTIYGSHSEAPYAPQYAPPPLPTIAPAQDAPFWGARLMKSNGPWARTRQWP